MKGYNFITRGIPSIILTRELIAVEGNPSIVTFKTTLNESNDMVCGAYSCNSFGSCDIDCKYSPNDFRFAIRFYSTEDYLTTKITVPGNYSQCGTYKITSIATYYTIEPDRVTTVRSSYINVRSTENSKHIFNDQTSIANSETNITTKQHERDPETTLEYTTQAQSYRSSYSDEISTENIIHIYNDQTSAANSETYMTTKQQEGDQKTTLESTTQTKNELNHTTSTTKFTTLNEYSTQLIQFTNEITSVDSLNTTENTEYDTFYNNLTFVTDFLLNSTNDLTGCLLNCSHHGFCRKSEKTNKYACDCNDYYDGVSCNIDKRPCSSSPCMHGAQCLNLISPSRPNQFNYSAREYECKCVQSYYGTYCEKKNDLCANITCSGNGYCTDLGNSTKCRCHQYFEGDNCETKSTELEMIKTMVSISTLLAYLIFGALALLIVLSDVINYFQGNFKLSSKRSTLKRAKTQSKPIQFVYYN